jgi:hypothetical protein
VASTTPNMRRVRAREYMELGVWGKRSAFFPILTLYFYPVGDDDEDEDAVGRLLRRCWRCGMPRCAAR